MNIIDQVRADAINSNDFLTTIRENISRMSEQKKLKDDHPIDMTDPTLFYITVNYKDLPERQLNIENSKYQSGLGLYSKSDLIEICLKHQGAFFKHIINQTVPNSHYPNRKKDYPVALCFIDFPNSRNCNPRTLEMPHTHAVLIVPPKTLPRFYDLLHDNFRLSGDQSKTRNVREVYCEEVPKRRSEIEKVISYSSKFYRSGHALNLTDEERSHLFCMYG